jgi:pimeloyl-ACP methyl ester carboxylesterase
MTVRTGGEPRGGKSGALNLIVGTTPCSRPAGARSVRTSADWLWPRRIPGIARLVVRLLDLLGYDQVDVLGVSLGGAVAQQLAHIAPRRVRRLVLAATTPGLGGIPGNPSVMLAFASPAVTARRSTSGGSLPTSTGAECAGSRPC